MVTFSLTEPLDNAIYAEAYDEFLDQYDLCEASIVNLEHQPSDKQLLNDLFRTVHTVKANSSILGFHPMVTILQELETVLDFVRQGRLPFSPRVGDLTLLMMDKAKNFMEQFHSKGWVEYDDKLYDDIGEGLQQLSQATPESIAPLLVKIIALIDPSTKDVNAPLDIPVAHPPMTPSLEDQDLQFLYKLASVCEQRVGFWQGRTQRVVRLALAMNEFAGSPVGEKLLISSLLCHDIAMAFLPTELLSQKGVLNEKQRRLVRQHVDTSSQLMRSINDSHVAGYILLQHQEHMDGNGYPKGLKERDICEGAKIMAIVHAFEAITHGHTSVSLHKRPLMRAVLEIHKKAGIEFSHKWVNVFTQVIRAMPTAS